MFVKQWKDQTIVSYISSKSILFKITKNYIVLLKIVKKKWTQALKKCMLDGTVVRVLSNEM